MSIFSHIFGKRRDADEKPASEPIDEETMEIAKELAYEKKVKRLTKAKWKRGKSAATEDDVIEAYKDEKKKAIDGIAEKVFERTVEDTVLANKFRDKMVMSLDT